MSTWITKHPTSEIDAILETTIKHMRDDLGVKKIGAVGYCFGGKYVARFLAKGKGVDAGFVAHPSRMDKSELEAIAGPFTIAAAGT
jgi:dienelactone hydrolase